MPTSIYTSLFDKPKRAPKPRSRRRGPLDMSDEGRYKRGRAACVWGDPLNADVYDPRESQLVPPQGAWAMIRRPLPPLERDLDQFYSVGRVFYVERDPGADENGFRSDGSYKVWARSPMGDVALWPYEYLVLGTEFIIEMWNQQELVLHPTSLSEAQLSDQVFYCRSRGIGLADAAVMCLGSLSAPIGWFEPSQSIVDFVLMFKEVGRGITSENRKRRAAARKEKPAAASEVHELGAAQ